MDGDDAQTISIGLLAIAGEFGLLHGTVVKEFSSYHLPERSFLYLPPRNARRNRLERMIDSIVLIGGCILCDRRTSNTNFFVCTSSPRLDYRVAGSLAQPIATWCKPKRIC